MNKTTNYELNLPSYEDAQDIEVLNENTIIIDEKLKELESNSGRVTSVNGKSGVVELGKNDIGLSEVDNVKQMPISNGVLENCREKLITLTGLTPNVDLSIANVFKLTLEGATTLSISNPTIDVSQSFTLIIIQPSIAHSINFPTSVKWMNETIPDLSTASKAYYLLFDTIDGGTTWHGRFGGAF